MSKERVYTAVLTRIELTWLHRQLSACRDMVVGKLKTYSGDVISKNKASEEELKEMAETQKQKDELDKLVQTLVDRLDLGNRERLQIVNLLHDLQEAYELAEEDSAKTEAFNRIQALPEEEDYRIQFDRHTVKFTLALIEKDLHKFRTEIIPAYENADAGEFEDPIMTKSYWVNKSKKSKGILESLKTKLEKLL